MAKKISGGKKAHKTTLERHGSEFVEERGRQGGRKSRGGGFAKSPERARLAAIKSWETRRKRNAESA